MIYVMSDLHGCYDKYIEMLEKIKFSSEDKLYILGDVVDRGNGSMKILLDMMRRPNVYPIMGNHDYMALNVLSKLNMEITEDNAASFDQKTIKLMSAWLADGGGETEKEFASLHHMQREMILEYMAEFSLYGEVKVNGREYILVHGGLGNFSPDKPLSDYELEELIYERPDYDKPYFEDKIVITGHTPTINIDMACKGRIFKENNHIAIDCGAVYNLGLGCICLDTMEEFYV
ncbi:MAG: serine/threonine protein phosphatase [Clostridia bacterium]|nr:serine/threonine protein phosphatase [Clostridia bacterium]